MRRLLIPSFVLLALCAFGLAVTGCNTVEGIGEDIQGSSDAGRRVIEGN